MATARRSFVPVHDRGQVLVDVAVMLADGGEAIGGIMLRHQAQVLGPVASAPTVWRALDELTPAALKLIEVARAEVRRHVGKTPDELLAIAADRGYDSTTKAGFIVDWLKNDFGVGRGHAMAFVHVVKNGPAISDKHVGTIGTHRDESNMLRLDGTARRTLK